MIYLYRRAGCPQPAAYIEVRPSLAPRSAGVHFYTAKTSGQMFDIFLAIHRAPCYNGCIEKREKDFPIYHTGGYFNGYEKTA